MHWGGMAWVWTQKGDARTGTGATKRPASTRAIMIPPCRQRLAAIPIASPQQSGMAAASVVPSINRGSAEEIGMPLACNFAITVLDV